MQKKKTFASLTCLTLILACLSLGGCQTTPEIPADADIYSLPVRECRESMTLSGRVSMQYTLSKNDNPESLHGKFAWKQEKGHAHISLFSPLGQTIALIDISPQEAVFTASGKPPVSAGNPDVLLFQQLGWPLPISGMRDWLQGCATDSAGKPFQASPRHPEVQTRDGWHIRYIGWTPFGKDRLAPRRIDMTHTPPLSAAVSSIHIRLIADEWENEIGIP